MKITLLTASTPAYWDIMQKSAPNKLEYCLRWKIQLAMKVHVTMSPWGEREQYMLQSLEECDWLWFMGADTLIMNQTLDVRNFLNNDFDFIIGKDIMGINNDVFFLRNNAKSREFLRRVLALNTSLGDDQRAMNVVMNEMTDFKVSIVSQKLFNAYIFKEYAYYPKDLVEGNFELGDFVLHLPGLPNGRRIQIMDERLPQVIR